MVVGTHEKRGFALKEKIEFAPVASALGMNTVSKDT